MNLLALMPGVGTVADGAELELTAMAFAEYRANVAIVLARGSTYEATTQAGAVMVRARPECALAADAWRRAHAGLQTLGLSPTSRPRVEGAIGPSTDRWTEFLGTRPPVAGTPSVAAYRAQRAKTARFFGDDGS